MRSVLFATVLGAGLLAGCEPDGTTSSPNRTTSTPSGTTNRQTQPSTQPGTTRTPSETTAPANNAQRDTQIVASIRDALTKDLSLSAEARNNIKIVSESGVVTLSGQVATEEEKMKIETFARNVPGVTRVENNLDVKG
jgi:osmotically-inducible protein OsmY